jgi:hypothetical protein
MPALMFSTTCQNAVGVGKGLATAGRTPGGGSSDAEQRPHAMTITTSQTATAQPLPECSRVATTLPVHLYL